MVLTAPATVEDLGTGNIVIGPSRLALSEEHTFDRCYEWESTASAFFGSPQGRGGEPLCEWIPCAVASPHLEMMAPADGQTQG